MSGDDQAEVAGRPIGRRIVLGMLAATVGGVLGGAKLQDLFEKALTPVTIRDPTGLLGFLPTGGRFRIYSVVGFLPERSRAAYRLTVDGLVERPLRLSYQDLGDLGLVRIVRDFQCVTGWRVRDVPWRGVPLSQVLDAAGPMPAGSHVRFHSFDGVYTESLTMEQARLDDVLVACELEDRSLPARHGGPVRLYVAPMYGYKSLKWLDRIEVVDREIPGYWEERGYDVDAWIGASNGRDDAPV